MWRSLAKSIFSTALITLGASLAHAQRLRVEGGINFSNIRLVLPTEGYSGDVLKGYRIGLGTEIRLGKKWHIAPMLMLKSTGATMNLRPELVDASSTPPKGLSPVISNTISVASSIPSIQGHQVYTPIFLGLRAYPIARWLGVQIEAGPYVGYTLSNKVHSGNQVMNIDQLERATQGLIKTSPWDYGMAGSIALFVSRIYLKAGLEYGLAHQFKLGSTEENLTNKNETIGLVPILSLYKLEKLSKASASNLNFYLSIGVNL